jgi:glutamate synthase (NADPH/NADH) large chain
LKILLAPMAITGQEALGSMGTDTPLSALSDKSKLLYTYFKQNFAQVTNPPIDPIREELVMSLVSFIGPRPNLFDLEGLSRRKRLEVRQPILTNEDLEKIRSISLYEDRFETKTLNMTYEASRGAAGMREALTMLCERAEAAVRGSYNIIILSDRMVGPDRIPMPALLATAAVHNHLIRKGLRTSVGLVVETGEAREVHHFCLPGRLWRRSHQPLSGLRNAGRHARQAAVPGRGRQIRSRRALHQGHRQRPLKVMSKMGISTYQSYCGAQIFDAVGLGQAFIDEFFTAPPPWLVASACRKSPARPSSVTPTPSPTIRCSPPISRGRWGIHVPHARRGSHVDARHRGDLQHAVRGNVPEKWAEIRPRGERRKW